MVSIFIIYFSLRFAGIRVTAVPPYSEYLNDVAEIFNGTPMDLVRAMLSSSELHHSSGLMWQQMKCVFTTVAKIFLTLVRYLSRYNFLNNQVFTTTSFVAVISLNVCLRNIVLNRILAVGPLQTYNQGVSRILGSMPTTQLTNVCSVWVLAERDAHRDNST